MLLLGRTQWDRQGGQSKDCRHLSFPSLLSMDSWLPSVDAPSPPSLPASAAASTVVPSSGISSSMLGSDAAESRDAVEPPNDRQVCSREELATPPRRPRSSQPNRSAGADGHQPSALTLPSIATAHSHDTPASYRLSSVVCHCGTSTNVGHYFAYVRSSPIGEGASGKSDWCLFNDARVTQTTAREVRNERLHQAGTSLSLSLLTTTTVPSHTVLPQQTAGPLNCFLTTLYFGSTLSPLPSA